MKSLKFIFIILISTAIACKSNKNTSNAGQTNNVKTNSANSPKALKIKYIHPQPVISKRTVGAKDNEYGFEGGRVVKINGTYHLFTSEMYKDPIWVNMRLGYWTSTDRVNWKRISTIRESNGEFKGKDPRASLWSPLPAWDEENNEWNIFYVAYRSEPNTPEKFLTNFEGRIWRSVSKVKGIEGISGPYEDKEIIMEPGSESQSWEGLQGVDSFFPWKVGNSWYAFYGSAKTEVKPVEYWQVGMASAPTLSGKWIRNPSNPSEIEVHAIENPIVIQADATCWLAVYDHVTESGTFGWSISSDGINWEKGRTLLIDSTGNGWCKEIRTPLGLVDEGNGIYTMFYTGFEEVPDWNALMAGTGKYSCAIGYVEIELK